MQPKRIYRYSVPGALTLQPARRAALPRQVAMPRRAHRMVDFNRLALAAAGTAIFVVLATGFLALALYLFWNFSGRVAPGVRVGAIPVGGLTEQAAAGRLRESWQSSSSAPVTVTDGRRRWQAAPAQLGFFLDPAPTARRAVAAARNQAGWLDALALLHREQRSVAPVFTFNAEMARGQLDQAAAQFDVLPVEAQVRYENGRWVALPGKMGQVLDVNATLADWQAQGEAYLRVGLLPVRMAAAPPAELDASARALALDALVKTPLRLQAYDPIRDETIDLAVPVEQLAGMLRVDGSDVALDTAGLNAFLQAAQASLGDGRYYESIEDAASLAARWKKGQPVTVLVKHPATEYIVERGDTLVSIAFKVGMPYWMIQRANPGVDANALSASQRLTIPSLDENLPLPVVLGKRIVISISRQRLWTYENGSLRSESVISTGIDRSPTMPGVFQVRSHETDAYASIWDLYMPHFLGIYEASPGFMNGLHGLPMLSSGVRLWGNVLGHRASYGCIILSLEEAEDLYSWAENGVVVEIQP